MSPSSGPAEIRLCHLTGWAHSQEAALAPTATLSEAAGCRDQASEQTQQRGKQTVAAKISELEEHGGLRLWTPT